ncbi:MAG: Hsp20/alpha crystallin family protein [Verrucomicrobia bacterium]|nr:Hsp20/alpha crystallin family protein [Verrucomicrobiota bacterium]
MISLLRPDLSRSLSLEDWLRDSLLYDDSLARGRSGLSGRLGALPADLYEDTEAYHALMELPGVTKENLEVTLENSVLRVSGKSHPVASGAPERVVEFSRSLAVPDGVNPAGVSAELRDGILHLRLAKHEERKPRTIRID